MPKQSLGKSGVLAYFGPKIGQIIWEMDSKFVLSSIYIDMKEQPKLEVYWTQIDHFIL